MVSKYDVFARIIESAPIKQKDLNFKSPVYSQIKSLLDMNYIKKTSSGYIPIKKNETFLVFDILKKSINKGINYNIFFSKEFLTIINELNKFTPKLITKKIQNNQNANRIINYLEEKQFILLRKKRPKIGTLLNTELFNKTSSLNNEKINIDENYDTFENILKKILKIPNTNINPFENNYFAHIAGNAQLEGSTITEGETIEILTKDIYPNKSSVEIQMIKNLNEAMIYIIDNLNEDITPEKIKKINEKVLFSLHRGAGEFKKIENKIFGNPEFKTTNPNLVLKEINEFCNMCNNLKSKEEVLKNIGIIHNTLQRIHPFADGNSRTTRIIVNWLFAKFGLPLLVLRVGSFDKYMSLTKLSKKRNDDELKLFFGHILVHENLKN